MLNKQSFIQSLKFDYGKIEKIQSSYIIISLYSEGFVRRIKISFIEKRDFKLKLKYKFISINVYQNHPLNLESRENFFEIYFTPIPKDLFENIRNKYVELLNKVYLPYKNFKYFINVAFIKELQTDEIYSGKLGIAPESVLNELQKNYPVDRGFSKFLIQKKWKSEGLILTLDNNFVWSENFEFTEI